MNALVILIPAALGLGILALCGFFWAVNTSQYEDLDGAAWRILNDGGEEDLPPTRPPEGG